MRRHSLDLGRGVRFRIFSADRYVETVYPDGAVAGAARDDTAANREEAADRGYLGRDAVWRSLVVRELGHTLVGRVLWGRESLVLRHQAGVLRALYGRRLHEEACVIAWQRFLQTRRIERVLWPLLPKLYRAGLSPTPEAL